MLTVAGGAAIDRDVMLLDLAPMVESLPATGRQAERWT